MAGSARQEPSPCRAPAEKSRVGGEGRYGFCFTVGTLGFPSLRDIRILNWSPTFICAGFAMCVKLTHASPPVQGMLNGVPGIAVGFYVDASSEDFTGAPGSSVAMSAQKQRDI